MSERREVVIRGNDIVLLLKVCVVGLREMQRAAIPDTFEGFCSRNKVLCSSQRRCVVGFICRALLYDKEKGKISVNGGKSAVQ